MQRIPSAIQPEQDTLRETNSSDVDEAVHQIKILYTELKDYNRCAMIAIEIKINLINENLFLQFGRSLIEVIKRRLKTSESYLKK